MTKKRTSMANIKEILRLKFECGFSVRKIAACTPCVRIVVASVFHKNITGSGKLDISEALS